MRSFLAANTPPKLSPVIGGDEPLFLVYRTTCTFHRVFLKGRVIPPPPLTQLELFLPKNWPCILPVAVMQRKTFAFFSSRLPVLGHRLLDPSFGMVSGTRSNSQFF